MASHHPLHLHSMMVHAVIALALVGSVAYLLEATGATVLGAGPAVWALLLRGSVVAMLLVAIPSTFSGVTERGRMYATWHPSHRAKGWLSAALLVLAAGESVALVAVPGPVELASPLAAAVVVGNPLLVLALSYYGLRITLGRQGWGRTSYVPDMHRDPPVDILDLAAVHAAEDPKLIDVLGEEQS